MPAEGSTLPAELAAAFRQVYNDVQPGLPFDPWAGSALEAYRALCSKAVDGVRRAGGFGEPERWQFDWDRPYSRAEWLDQLPTFGGHSQLPAPTLEELLTGIAGAVDAVGGRFTMHYSTVAVAHRRLDGA